MTVSKHSESRYKGEQWICEPTICEFEGVCRGQMGVLRNAEADLQNAEADLQSCLSHL